MKGLVKKTFTLKSKYDEILIHALAIYKEEDIRAVVQFSHGMSEHKERYIPVMEFLAEHGYACVIHDHRGHGESIKQEEDLGYFYTGKEAAVIEDLHDISMLIRNNMPQDMKLILFGHSMGSLIVRAYTAEYDDEIDGLVVCGSPSNNPAAGAGLFVVRLMQKFKPDRHRSGFINKLVFGKNSSGFEKKENSWLCTDEAIVDSYNADSRDGAVFTLNGFESLFGLVRKVYDKAVYKVKNSKLPILFIAGADDPVIINSDKWYEAQHFLKELGYSDISSVLYPGMRHEILNERDKQRVYEDVLAFVEKCIK